MVSHGWQREEQGNAKQKHAQTAVKFRPARKIKWCKLNIVHVSTSLINQTSLNMLWGFIVCVYQ